MIKRRLNPFDLKMTQLERKKALEMFQMKTIGNTMSMTIYKITMMSSRVNQSNKGYWKKLLHVMNFLKNTRDYILTLEAGNSPELKWYVDAAFVVHPDMTRHTSAVFTLGNSVIISDSTKRKSNAGSSTEAELMALTTR